MTSQSQPTSEASLFFQRPRRALSEILALCLDANLRPQYCIKALLEWVASFFVFIAFEYVFPQYCRQNPPMSLFGYHSIVSNSFTFVDHRLANVPDLCRISCGQGLFLNPQFLYCCIFQLKAVVGLLSNQSTQLSLQMGSPRVAKPSNL